MKRALQLGALGLLLLLVFGVVAPFIRVDQYREQIRGGLERALRRKVDIHGETTLNLFRGPGFSVQKVVIHDDPSVGLEPLANVPELQASVRMSSLWTGQLEFSTVRFVEPSLNIVKPDKGPWNVTGLLAAASARAAARLPEIQVSDGRLNFKFGDLKSAFYLTNADVTVSPSRGGLDIRFAVAPARTDRGAQGYGVFSGSGRWADGLVDIDLELEKSSIEELVTLARGQSLGMHGRISSRAKLSGPVTNTQIKGRFDLEDVHRWDLIQGRTGGVALNYQGKFDFGAQRLELVADTSMNPGVPLALKLVIAEILYNPNWTAEVAINRLPAASIVEAARHMGAPIRAGLKVEGNAVGVIAYGSLPGLQGHIEVDDATVQLDNGPAFKLPNASVLIANDELRLMPATLSGQSRAAQLAATYAPIRQHLEARVAAKGLPITDLQNGPGHLLNGASVPLFSRFKGGTWSGTLTYTSGSDEPGEWNANLQVRDTTTSLPGIAGPVRLLAADVELEGDAVRVRRMRATAAGAEVFGEYRYDPSLDRPHRFALTIPSIKLEDLEAALLPTLRRESNSFLARTLRFRSSSPEWLRGRRAEGSVRIGALIAGENVLRAVRGRVLWNGSTIVLPAVEARLEEALIRTSLTADLGRTEPRYALKGSVRNLAWRGGSIDLLGTIDSSGTGLDVLANAHAGGSYEARSLTLGPEFEVHGASGTFDLLSSRTGPQLKLTVTQVQVGSERFTGEGTTQPDGKLHVDLASGTRTMRLTGPVAPLKLEVTNDRTTR